MTTLPSSPRPHQDIERVKGNLFFGSTFEVLKNPVAFLSKLAKNYGPAVTAHFAGKKYYVFQHPDYVKHVWLDNHKNYLKPGATKLLGLFLGEGLSTSNGELWLTHRRLMQPAFHTQRLEGIADVINEETTELITRFEKIPADTIIDINHEMLQLTINIISRAMFNVHMKDEMDAMVHALEELASFAASWMKSPIKIPTNWPTPGNKIFKENCAVFDKIIYAIIERRRRELATKNGPVHNDLLDMLLSHFDEETQSPMSDKLLRDEVTTIFMAGHETSAQTLSWMLYHAAKEKDISEKLRQEAIASSSGQRIGFAEISKLVYNKQVVHETLRLYPPIWAVVRTPLQDDKINSLYLPAHSNVLLNIYGLHRHPDYWESPDEFFPEHFSAVNEQSRPAFVFVPFGGGPRLCLGHNFAMLVMRIVISRLVRSFEFFVPENYVPVVEPNITLRARQGIQLTIKKIV